jgi:hypothetical protein
MSWANLMGALRKPQRWTEHYLEDGSQGRRSIPAYVLSSFVLYHDVDIFGHMVIGPKKEIVERALEDRT